MLLWALGRLQRGEPRLVAYRDAEAPLAELLAEFGPVNPTSPHYPFWHAVSDGVWALQQPDEIPRTGRRPTLTAMRAHALGGLPDLVDHELRGDGALLSAAVAELLGYLPGSQSEEILAACGLTVAVAPRRDAAFRALVIMAYEGRCAICGWDVRLAGQLVGLDAAHVWQWSAGGPDRIENGMALCSLHHKAYDRGAISLDDDRRVLVSQHLNGGDRLPDAILRYAGRPLAMPQAGHEPISPLLARRHRDAMFRAPARVTP